MCARAPSSVVGGVGVGWLTKRYAPNCGHRVANLQGKVCDRLSRARGFFVSSFHSASSEKLETGGKVNSLFSNLGFSPCACMNGFWVPQFGWFTSHYRLVSF